MPDLLALSTTPPTTCPRGRSGESCGTSPGGRRSTGGRHPAIAAHTTNTERNMSMEDRSFLGGCERAQAPRRPDAASLDLQPLRYPRLSAIRGAIAGPGEAVRPDVVVADPPDRRVRAHHAELLLDVHFRADAMAGSDVLQSRAALGRDQLPLIEDGVVSTQRVGDVVRLATVAHDAILVQHLRPVGEARRTPVAAAVPKLPAHGGELPIAEQVIEITLMGVVGRPDLLSGPLAGGLGGERWCEGRHRNEQGVAHDDLPVETGRLVAFYRNRRSSTSDRMNPNAGQPPERTERSNQARACAVSPRTRYQLPTP